MATAVMTKSKAFERFLLAFAVVVSAVFIFVMSLAYDQYIEQTYPKSDLYGTWIEQDVADYAAEEFILGRAGVSINGGIVDTDYSFDGKYLEYQFGNEIRRYKILNQDFTEMKLVSEPHYQPVFRLVVRYRNNINIR